MSQPFEASPMLSDRDYLDYKVGRLNAGEMETKTPAHK